MHGLCMLVFGYFFVGGMVLLGYDNGFRPFLDFLWMPWCVGILILVLSFGFSIWILESRVEVVSRFIPKGLGFPRPILEGYPVNLEGGVSV